MRTKQSRSNPEQLSLFGASPGESRPSRGQKKTVKKPVAVKTQHDKPPSPAPDKQERRRTIRVPEAAKMLGISRASAYEAVNRGEIPSVKIGRRVLIPLAALEHLLAGANFKEKN